MVYVREAELQCTFLALDCRLVAVAQQKKLMGNQQVAITSCTSQSSSSNDFHAIGNEQFQGAKRTSSLFFVALFAKKANVVITFLLSSFVIETCN